MSQHGCLVVNAPTANTVAAAEHGIALLCSLSRNVSQADASMKAGKWERNKYVGVSLVDKTLAIMGFGKVCASRQMRRDMYIYRYGCTQTRLISRDLAFAPHYPPLLRWAARLRAARVGWA